MATNEEKSLSSSRVCGPSSANVDLLECSICHDLLWKPVACQSCETPFCSACINKWLANNPKVCPHRCETYTERKCPPIIAKLLSQLQITCSNKEQGCQEAIAYEALEKHESECDYQFQQCSGCQSQILKKDFMQHESNCTLIELTCQDCKLVYRRGDAVTKHTENICLREQLQQLRDESKKSNLEIQELSRQLREIRSLNPISSTAILTFADLPSAQDKSLNIPPTYKGLKWSTIAYMHRSFATKKYSKTGYASAFTIGGSPHIAFFKDRASMSVEHPNETFTLLSLDACAAWRDGLQLTIRGYQNSIEINTHTVTLLFGMPQNIVLQWNNIDKVVFESSGGTQHPGCSQSASPHVVLTKIVIRQFN